MHNVMQEFDLALFQQRAADQPSILLKHLDPNTRHEAQWDIAACETKLKGERKQSEETEEEEEEDSAG